MVATVKILSVRFFLQHIIHDDISILSLQLLRCGGFFLSMTGTERDLLLVSIAEMVLPQEDAGDGVDLAVLHIILPKLAQQLVRSFY